MKKTCLIGFVLVSFLLGSFGLTGCGGRCVKWGVTKEYYSVDGHLKYREYDTCLEYADDDD